MTKEKKHRYRHVDGKRLIELRVKTATQLFDIRDPAPFRERDLDDDFVEYITSAVKEFSLKTQVKILIHIESPEAADLGRDAIKEAVQSHFSYLLELQNRKLSDFIRRGQIALTIGLVLLISFLGLSFLIPNESNSAALSILKEGAIIIGWVSMWRPIEMLLFDWWPIFEHKQLLQKLLISEFEIQFGPTS